MDTTIGVYVHIPFCIRKCPYCSFNSVVTTGTSNDSYADLYINAVLKELLFHIREYPDLSDNVLETIYIGGGTPSLMPPESIDRLVDGIQAVFPASSKQEITIEVNPGTVTYDKLIRFKEAGINRLSIGVQSFNENGLKSLGRIHSVQDSLNCYEDTRKAGFNNIGIDLIFGIPDQSIAEWEAGLEKAVSLKPEHISAYNLTIEDGTPFYKLLKDGRLLLPSEEDQVRMFESGIDRLKSAGYIHYEISNYALDGFESCHNNRYWLGKNYIGLGAGSHSYTSFPDWGLRWWNETDPSGYIQHITNTGHAVTGMERLTQDEAITEAIFLGLRRMNGIDMDLLSERFSISFKNLYRHRVETLKTDGLLKEEARKLRLTRRGIIFSNTVIESLI